MTPTQRTLKLMRSRGWVAESQTWGQCVVEGCERRIRSDNKTGHCRKHHNQSEYRKDVERQRYAKNRGAIIARQRSYPVNRRNVINGHLRRRYGMTVEDKVSLLLSQGGCAICRKPPTDDLSVWHVDHDHESGRVRGVLCRRCNQGIGFFGDSPATLLAAIAYLGGKA